MWVKALRICHGKPCTLARTDKEVCIVEMGDVAQLLPLRDESTIVYGRTFLRHTPLRCRISSHTRPLMLFLPFFLAGIIDHIDAERRTNPAARTVRTAAVLRKRRGECLLPLRFQIAFEYAGRGVRPRQRFTDRARAAAVIRPVDAAVRKCGEIVCIVEEIRPAVKLCPAFPCGV